MSTGETGRGLFRNGFDELKRKLQRRKLRKRLKTHDRARGDLLGKLGQHAAQCGMDLSDHSTVRDQIAQLQSRAGELAEYTRALEAHRSTLQEQRNAQKSTYDAQLSAIETKKRPIDSELAAARQRYAQQESVAKNAQAQLLSFPKEREQLV